MAPGKSPRPLYTLALSHALPDRPLSSRISFQDGFQDDLRDLRDDGIAEASKAVHPGRDALAVCVHLRSSAFTPIFHGRATRNARLGLSVVVPKALAVITDLQRRVVVVKCMKQK